MTWILLLLYAGLLAQLCYPALAVILAQWRKQKAPVSDKSTPVRFACIITAYRNIDIARPLVESLLQQTYSNHRIYLVADACPDFDFGVRDERYLTLIPDQPLHLKIKSIQYAMDRLVEQPDYVVIFDADNVAHPDFLAGLIPWIKAGFSCVQGRRTAKNLDTSYAALDSLGEHYKNYLEREVAFRLGSSAVISGSGMATEYSLYKAYLESDEVQQGQLQWKKMLQEDKILQNFLLRQNERIAYARQAVVYDEKVRSGEAVETQRSRWLYSYFQNIPNALGLVWRGLLGGSFNQVYFGAITLVLPLFIQVGLAGICLLTALFWSPVWALWLALGLVIFATNLLWVLHLDGAPGKVKRVVWQAPQFILRQAKALWKMRDPNRNFRHTEHSKVVNVENVLQEGNKDQ
ncbi:MAG: glycosyltransferase [Saprospiraceae bacterium]|nr:glycosyltransferase [Saprospiraceae bacterium]